MKNQIKSKLNSLKERIIIFKNDLFIRLKLLTFFRDKNALQDYLISKNFYREVDSYKNNYPKQNQKTISIDIENTSDEEKDAVIFGSLSNCFKNNFGNDSAIKIKCLESSYPELLSKLLVNTLLSRSVFIVTMNSSQATNEMFLNFQDVFGLEVSDKIIPAMFFAPNQFHSNSIFIDFNEAKKIDKTFLKNGVLIIQPETSITLKVKPKTVVTLYFSCDLI